MAEIRLLTLDDPSTNHSKEYLNGELFELFDLFEFLAT